MKIAVINGSPKGSYSITLQTVRYLQIKYPEHSFKFIDAGQKIRVLERDFSEVKAQLEESDALLFSYPVYTFLAPSQLHRFIELLFENSVALDGKYATEITTSKHFYDVTAHKYIEENSLDLGMRFIRGLSADMEDLLTERGRADAEAFFDRFLFSVKEGIYTELRDARAPHVPVPASRCDGSEDKLDRDVLIITDNTDPDSNLAGMIERFRAVLPYMRRQRSGRLVMTSSVAGVTPIPFQTWYSASKAAIISYSMALMNEVRPYHVGVAVVMPGDIKTGFTAARRKSAAGNDEYSGRIERSVSKMEKDEQNGLPASYAGKIIAKAALRKRPKPLTSTGFVYSLLCTLAKIMPARFAQWILYQLYAK